MRNSARHKRVFKREQRVFYGLSRIRRVVLEKLRKRELLKRVAADDPIGRASTRGSAKY